MNTAEEKSEKQYFQAASRWLHELGDLATNVDFERKRTAFFLTGPVHPEDIEWVLGRVSLCSRVIVHQWAPQCEESGGRWLDAVEIHKRFNDKRLYWAIDSDLDRSIHSALKFMDKDLMDSWQPVLSKARVKEQTELIMPVIRRLGEALNVDNLGKNTKISITGLVLRNALINLPRLNKKGPLSSYLDSNSNVPTVIVATGPSLTKQLPILYQYQDYLNIIAVDGAWSLLAARGIRPDVMIALDPLNLPQWDSSVWPTNVTLVADIGCTPELVNSIDLAGVFTFHQAEVGSLIQKLGGETEFLPTGGSVATSGFTLAFRLNANPIVLIGQDLAHTGGRDHAEDYVYAHPDHVLIERSAMGLDIEGYYGDRVRTERQFLFYKTWLEEQFKLVPESRLIINSTEGGARIKGALQIPFLQVCQEIKATGIRKKTASGNIHAFDSVHVQSIIENVKRVIEKSRELKKLAKSGQSVLAKTGTKNYAKQIRKIDGINAQIKDFDRDIKSLIDIFGIIRLEAIRKGIRRAESDDKQKKIQTAMDKYGDIYETIISNTEYIESKLDALNEYFEALIIAQKFYIPDLAKKVWG